MEETSLRELVDYKSPYLHAVLAKDLNAQARNTTVAMFLCPSDSAESVSANLGGPNNYHVNQGTGILWSVWPAAAPNDKMPPPNGVMYRNSRTAPKHVTDGLSNTAAFAERVVGDSNQGVSTPLSDSYAPGASPANVDEALRDCLAVDINDLSKQGFSDVGAPWIRAYHSTTMYFHGDVPNGRSCMFPPGRIMTTASSNHSSGVNVLLCDASARLVANDVDLPTSRALGTRAGEEVAHLPQ